MTTNQQPNRLIKATSPYLLQHAYNPVDWYEWGPEALAKAKAENKPILVSIGYSACHWCHVMEHESFENEATAQLMNANFVCIKIDREERPDIDNIYMEAVQLMGLNGGWPLNVFLLPDLRPFYGGTYFQPAHWQHLLNQIATAYSQHYDKLVESAAHFAEGLNRDEIDRFKLRQTESQLTKADIDDLYRALSTNFDLTWGGTNRSPKFMMPSVWQWLWAYVSYTGRQEAADHLHLTLSKMARGGLYDQIGGGFSRYSVDAEWFAPHFEKMLYDNGQLLSLFAKAWTLDKSPLYSKVLNQTINWLVHEMRSPEGGYYAALDADSEGEEGKFYTYTWLEWSKLLGLNAELAAAYFSFEPHGNWEHGRNILFPKTDDKKFAERYDLTLDALQAKVDSWTAILLADRVNRVRPGLDDKIITGWNGLLLSGFSNVASLLRHDQATGLAVELAQFISSTLIQPDGTVVHSYKQDSKVNSGFLDDYALVAKGFIDLYQVTLDSKYLHQAKSLAEKALELFNDEKGPFLYYSSYGSDELIARKKEIFDNVIPSSNAVMADVLQALGTYFYEPTFTNRAKSMMSSMQKAVKTDVQYAAYWGQLLMTDAYPQIEVVVVGPGYEVILNELRPQLPACTLVYGAVAEDESILTKGRQPKDGQSLIYICQNNTCQLPVTEVDAALEAIASLLI